MVVETRGLKPEDKEQFLAWRGSAHPQYLEDYRRLFESPELMELRRVTVVDGRPVSTIGVFLRERRLGSCLLPCGELGDVGTHPDFRKRGYGRLALLDSVSFMKGKGCLFSTVESGVFGFYCSGGWEIWPEDRFVFELPAKPVLPPAGGHTVRQFDGERDAAAVSRIYDTYNAARSFTEKRGLTWWQRWTDIKPAEGLAFWVAENKGEVVAFARAMGELFFSPELLGVIDASFLPGAEEAVLDLFRTVLIFAWTNEYRVVRAYLPLDSPLVACFQTQPQFRREDASGNLVRTIDLPGLLQALSPSISQLGSLPEMRLCLAVGDQEALLELSKGSFKVSSQTSDGKPAVKLNQVEFFQLITGRKKVEELKLAEHFELPPQSGEALAQLFVPTNPVFWRGWDWGRKSAGPSSLESRIKRWEKTHRRPWDPCSPHGRPYQVIRR